MAVVGEEIVEEVGFFTGGASCEGLMGEDSGNSLAIWVQFVDHRPEVFGGLHFARELNS